MIEIEFARARRKTKTISMIPLIDVMLALLIFFLIAGRLEQVEVLKVSPPVSKSGEELAQGTITIVLGKHDEVLINDELGTLEEVLPKLKEQLKHNNKRLITLKADNRMNATRLIEVMNAIRAAGGENLTLATESP
jgi:biopolymer transport protein ExbD